MDTLEIQTKLQSLGFDPGPLDGRPGPRTRGACVAFQERHGLTQDGIAGPQTIAKLREATGTSGRATVGEMPPWMAEMYRRRGLHERRDNLTLAEWLKRGLYLGNPARLPWCGDAVETCFAVTLPNEPLPANPFWAQSWATFGQDVRPRVGAVGVIRWSAKTGHVGIVSRVTNDHIWLLGGNQSDAITHARFPRSRVIAFRWPNTFPVTEYPALTMSGHPIGSAAATR